MIRLTVRGVLLALLIMSAWCAGMAARTLP